MRKKSFLATLLFALALTIATFMLAVTGCKKDDTPSTAAGSYYLSVLDGGTWTKYTSDSAIPTDKKFVKGNGDIYTLTLDLEQGDSVKIAQVGSDVTYGGNELFSVPNQLQTGADNALSVTQSGSFELQFDAKEKEIEYVFTAHVQAVLVEIDDAAEFTVTVGGEGKQLTATATLDNDTTTQSGITWEIADTSVATVSESGLVTAVAAGTTTIKAKHGSVESDPLTVNVNGSVTLSKETLKLAVNGEETLTYTAVGGAVAGEWSSTDTDVVTVDSNGKVTAVATGTAKIRLSYTPRTGATPLFAECEVTVDVPVTNITLNQSAISVAKESTATIKVGITPSNATNKNYTYEITQGNDKITVAKNENTLTVTPVAEGTATITVTSEDGNYTASCEVTVVAEGTVTANLSASLLRLNLGTETSETLSVNITGDTVSSVDWSSSASGVATVSDEGVVTAVAYGTTVITAAITTDGGQSISKTCTVLVAPETFFLYGYGLDTWQSDESAVKSDVKFTDNNDGTFTLTREMEDLYWGFRIGHIDNGHFFLNDSGYGYSHITTGDNFVEAGGTNNIKTAVKGEYSITVDLTGAKAKITVVRNSIAVSGIEIEADKSTLKAGDADNKTAVITLTVNPEGATYTQDDVVWTCDETNVTIVKGENTLTVTAKDGAASVDELSVTCTVKGTFTKTVNLTILAAGATEIKPTSVEFEQAAYTQNVNGTGGWSVDVKANVKTNVDKDATNKSVNYSCEDSSVTIEVDAKTGIATITASKIGTFAIKATAAGDSTVSATAKVTFYSDQFYLIGDADNWGSGATGKTTKDTQYENFTFESTGESNTMFSLKVMLTKDSKFQILFCGGDWNTVLKGSNVTLSGIVSKDDSNNLVIGGDDADGVYIITLYLEDIFSKDVSNFTPEVNVIRSYGIPELTAKIVDGTEETSTEKGTVVFNRFTMNYEGTFAENAEYYIKITESNGKVKGLVQGVSTFVGNNGYFEDATDAFKCLVAGKYGFEIVCDADGKVSKVTVAPITDDPPVLSTDYTLSLKGDPGFFEGYTDNWSETEIGDAVLYYKNGVYTFYFKVTNVVAYKSFNIAIHSTDADGASIAFWSGECSPNATYTDVSGDWLAKSLNGKWENVQSSSSGTFYCAISFKATGITAITCSSNDDLKPATEA